jgi:hypothetical protein
MILVDNSPNNYAEKLAERYPDIRIGRIYKRDTITHTIDECWRDIIIYAKMNKIPMIASIECDIIVPPNMLSYLYENISNCDMVSHTVPARGDNSLNSYGLGCVLMRTSALPVCPNLKTYNFESYIYTNVDRQRTWKFVKGLLNDMEHLEYPDKSELRKEWGEGAC